MELEQFLHIQKIKDLFDCPENLKYHPEGNTGEHVKNALAWLKANCPSNLYDKCFLAVLLHDIGKPLTDKERFPKHPKHDVLGAELILDDIEFRQEIKNVAGNDINWVFIVKVCRYHMEFWHFKDRNMKAQSFLKIMEDVGDENFEAFLWSIFADNCSNDDVEDKNYRILFDSLIQLHKDMMKACDSVKQPDYTNKRWKNLFWSDKVNECRQIVHQFVEEAQQIVFDGIVQKFSDMLKTKYNSDESSVSINKENSTLLFQVGKWDFLIERDLLSKCNGRVITEDMFDFQFSEDFKIWFVKEKINGI